MIIIKTQESLNVFMSIRYPSDIIFHVYSFNLMLMKIYDIV